MAFSFKPTLAKLKSNNAGFTLIELLVVIAIIGTLSGMVMVAMTGVRERARDARRLSDARQIVLALQMYHAEYGKYPGPTVSYGEKESASVCGGYDTSMVDNDGDGRPFIEPLIDSGIMSVVPGDPLGTDLCDGYAYYRYDAGYGGCDAVRGAFFVLGTNMETSGNPHPASPGWSCPTRNWQGEFDWVTGGFEK